MVLIVHHAHRKRGTPCVNKLALAVPYKHIPTLGNLRHCALQASLRLRLFSPQVYGHLVRQSNALLYRKPVPVKFPAQEKSSHGRKYNKYA